MMMNTLGKEIASLEQIGAIGSPSSTNELSIDVLGSAVNRKLVGELAFFEFDQSGQKHYALGQVIEIELRNVWLEDPTMRSLARHKGHVNPISGQQDTHIGVLSLSAVFGLTSHGYVPSLLGTVPPTGTPLYLATDELIIKLLENYQNEVFYLGNVYQSSPKLPLWFKHFGKGQHGAGEAYHIGVFGKTGSGKSVLAKEVLLAYARHKEMGIFILDPQGEFSSGLRDNANVDFGNILGPKTLGFFNRKFKVADIDNLILDSYELFTSLLYEYNFFAELNIKSHEYQQSTADILNAFLKNTNKIKLSTLKERESLLIALDHISSTIHRVYSSAGKGAENVQERIMEFTNEENLNDFSSPVGQIWKSVTRFFSPDSKKVTPRKLINRVLSSGKEKLILSIDLSKKPQELSRSQWDEKIKPLILDNFLTTLIYTAEYMYEDKSSLNTLVLIDEAHRIAPSGRIENKKKASIRTALVDAIRTTRKYGLGWMFISQTISSIDRALVNQMRIGFYGFGLSMGTEFSTLKELVGGDRNSLKLYQSFRDPHSSFSVASRQYSFMTVGPVSPLSFSGTPLFFTAFNSPAEFLTSNSIEIDDAQNNVPSDNPPIVGLRGH